MTRNCDYSYSSTEIGGNGYNMWLSPNFTDLCLKKTAISGICLNDFIKAAILKSVGIDVHDRGVLLRLDKEIDTYDLLHNNGFVIFISVSDNVSSLIKSNANALNISPAEFVGSNILNYALNCGKIGDQK